MNINQIAMYYILMDSSQLALQTNEKLFSNLFLKFWPKTRKCLKNRGVNIDQIVLYYISLDSTRQALQTNGKFFQISELLFELVTMFFNNSGNGRGGGGICAEQHVFYFYHSFIGLKFSTTYKLPKSPTWYINYHDFMTLLNILLLMN